MRIITTTTAAVVMIRICMVAMGTRRIRSICTFKKSKTKYGKHMQQCNGEGLQGNVDTRGGLQGDADNKRGAGRVTLVPVDTRQE